MEGVLWKLTQTCEKSLDHYEGFPVLYGKETVRVRGSDGTEHCVTAYTMQEPYSRIPAMPSMGYLAGILAGCEQNGIDEKPSCVRCWIRTVNCLYLRNGSHTGKRIWNGRKSAKAPARSGGGYF